MTNKQISAEAENRFFTKVADGPAMSVGIYSYGVISCDLDNRFCEQSILAITISVQNWPQSL